MSNNQNKPCACLSGKKFKQCCGAPPRVPASRRFIPSNDDTCQLRRFVRELPTEHELQRTALVLVVEPENVK